jgi:hypothetical protein
LDTIQIWIEDLLKIQSKHMGEEEEDEENGE